MFEFFQKGGPLMWPLAALSFLSVTFIIERCLFLWGVSLRRCPRHLKLLFKNAERGRFDRAQSIAQRAQKDFVIRTLLKGLEHRTVSLTSGLENQAMNEMRKINKHLMILDTVITAAPLLGILGTVVGIIFSFDVLGSQGVSDPMAVTSGISQALLTTAFGLAIALLTLLPYNYFQSFCRRAAEELERHSSALEIILQKVPPRSVPAVSSAEENPHSFSATGSKVSL